MKGILVTYFIIALVSAGCDKKQKALTHYINNQEVTTELLELYKLVDNKLTFKGWYIRNLNDRILVMFDESPERRITYYFDDVGVLLSKLENENQDSDENRYDEFLDDLVKGDSFRLLIRKFIQSGYYCINGNEYGTFFSINYSTIKNKHPDAELGILFVNNDNFNKDFIIEQIDTNTYLYETVVP